MSSSAPSSGRESAAGIFGRYADQAPVGDVIPFFDDGAYHLFCLTPPAGTLYFPDRLRTSWRHLRSTDLVRWEQLADALTPGGDGDPDRDGIWTGSVLRAGPEWHIFYTGQSLDREISQSVCHATSPDGISWIKDPGNPISVPDRGRFEGKDWRDPFVFWNPIERRYWMLLSARSKAHPAVSRGVIAVQTSVDLSSWTEPEELYDTFLSHCPECPEIFPAGSKWVMGYSRFTGRRGTVYRVADSPRGPWRQFTTDGLDSANWYAAKSLTDESGRRVAFGWVPDRNPAPSATADHWLWGGDLAVPRELALDDRGQLVMRLPAEIGGWAGRDLAYTHSYGTGAWSATPGGTDVSFEVEAGGRFGYCLLHPEGPGGQYLFSARVCGAQDAAVYGLAVQTSEQLDCGVAILCYPREQRVTAVDLTAGRSQEADEYEKAATEYVPVAESSLAGTPLTEVGIRIVVRDDIVEAFVADVVCLTYRLPAHGTEHRAEHGTEHGAARRAGSVALLIQDGAARFTGVRGQRLGAPG